MSGQKAAISAALQRCKTTFNVTVYRKGKTNQVVFLEAGKDFVDTLFSFLLCLSAPSFTFCRKFTGIQVKPRSGISSIYGSVESSILHVDEQDLLQPRPSAPGCTVCKSISSLQVQLDLEAADILRSPPRRPVLPQYYFKCTSLECSGSFLSSDRGEMCEVCRLDGYPGYYCDGPYSVQKRDLVVRHPKSGLVKENIKFLVTDNLEIEPSNAMTTMIVLKEVGIDSVDDLECKAIAIGITQILQLLHSALISNTCLNDVFGLMK